MEQRPLTPEEKELEHLREQARKWPWLPKAYAELAQACSELKHTDEAREVVRRGLEVARRPIVHGVLEGRCGSVTRHDRVEAIDHRSLAILERLAAELDMPLESEGAPAGAETVGQVAELPGDPYGDNPFELLGVSPECSTVEIQDIVRERLIDAETGAERELLRAAYQRLTHPMQRLNHQVFCCPGIDMERRPSPEFTVVLAGLRQAELVPTFLVGLAAGLDAVLSRAGAYAGILRHDGTQGSAVLDAEAWSRFVAERSDDAELVHCLAVLHHRWAFEFEAASKERLADAHWRLALRYWARLARSPEFWSRLRAVLAGLSLWSESEFSAYRASFLSARILSVHGTLAQVYQTTGQVRRGTAHCLLLRQAAAEFKSWGWQEAVDAVDSTLEGLTTAYLDRAHAELAQVRGVEQGLRRRYRPAIQEALRLLVLDPPSLRGLRFVVGQCCDWCEDLYVNDRRADMREATGLVRPYADRFAERVAHNGGLLTDRPVLSRFYMLLAFSLADEALGDDAWSQAEVAYRRSLELDPHNRNAQELYGHFALTRAARARDRGEHGHALRLADCVPGEHPAAQQVPGFKASVYNLMGKKAVEEERYSDAVRHCEQAVRLNPTDPVLKQNLQAVRKMTEQQDLIAAAKARDKGRYEEALQRAGRIGAGHPLYADTRKIQASIFNAMSQKAANAGDLAGALSHARKALEFEPGDAILQQNVRTIQAELLAENIPAYLRAPAASPGRRYPAPGYTRPYLDLFQPSRRRVPWDGWSSWALVAAGTVVTVLACLLVWFISRSLVLGLGASLLVACAIAQYGTAAGWWNDFM